LFYVWGDSQVEKILEVFQFYQKVKKMFEEVDNVELAKPFQLIQDAVTQRWVLNPRFSTLETQINSSHNDSD
jgi:hypothetical protein